jgi:fructokinase
LICTLSPQRIILGGGVMQQTALFPMVRQDVQQLLHGYLPTPAILEQIDEYIVPAALGNRAGVLGAIALAKKTTHEA